LSSSSLAIQILNRSLAPAYSCSIASTHQWGPRAQRARVVEDTFAGPSLDRALCRADEVEAGVEKVVHVHGVRLPAIFREGVVRHVTVWVGPVVGHGPRPLKVVPELEELALRRETCRRRGAKRAPKGRRHGRRRGGKGDIGCCGGGRGKRQSRRSSRRWLRRGRSHCASGGACATRAVRSRLGGGAPGAGVV